MEKIIELLAQRRIWAGIVGFVAFLAQLLELDIDTEALNKLLMETGSAFATLVTAGLALHSFFKPKKK